jgi:hypothetical protein
MKTNRKITWLIAIAVSALAPLTAGAQVLTADQLKKVAPTSFFFSGQSANVQMRNLAGFKNSAGKLVLAGLVDTSGYSTGIAEKYQGFLITETKLTFEGATLEPGEYGFGFREGKFTVMNVAAADVLSVASQNDDQIKHPVPFKFEKHEGGFRICAGRKFVVANAD